MHAFSLLLSLLAVVAEGRAVDQAEATTGAAAETFRETFEAGWDRWEILDPKTWKLSDRDGSQTAEITARKSDYKPPHRSPGHVMLVKDFKAADVEITFRVKSTKDTGNHRDCCVFFGWHDAGHFYYVHLGARPDPHSGQIMIVDGAPRRALTENKRRTPWTDDWHTVRVTRNALSGEIAVYFDDMEKPHMTATDKTFGEGRVGIGSFDDLNAFDDVVVRAL